MIGWTPRYSVEAERAIRGINRVTKLVGGTRKLIRGLPAAQATTLGIELNDVAIVRAVSVLESYLTDRADTIVRRDLPVPPSPSQLVAHIHGMVLGSFRGSFERGTQQFWTKGLGIKLATGPRWTVLDDYRELRNTIVHSLGYVRAGTPLRPSIAARLLAVTASPNDYAGRVPTSDKDFDDLVAAVRDYILWLDPQRP